MQLKKSKDEIFELNKIKNQEPKIVEISKPDDEKIKDDLNCRIKVLENQLDSYRQKNSTEIPEYEKKLEKNQLYITELINEKDTLNSKLEILGKNSQNENLILQRKLEEKEELLNELTNNRDKKNSEFAEERNKYRQNLLKLEKEISELRNSKINLGENSNGNINDRVSELEFYLMEVKNKNNLKEKELENLYRINKELNEENDILKRNILKSTGEINDIKGINKQINFDYEIANKNLIAKEEIIQELLEEKKNNKIKDDKTILELAKNNKELKRKLEELNNNNYNNNEDDIVCADNPQENQYYELMELKSKNAEISQINISLENEVNSLNKKNKQMKSDADKLLKNHKELTHINEELKLNNEEMKHYYNFYNDLKPNYDEKVAEIEIMKSKYADFDKTLRKEELKYKELLQKYENLKKINSEQDKIIKELEAEIDLAKNKLDLQYEEIQTLKRNNNNNNYNNENDNNKQKILELNKEIENLNLRLRNSAIEKSSPSKDHFNYNSNNTNPPEGNGDAEHNEILYARNSFGGTHKNYRPSVMFNSMKNSSGGKHLHQHPNKFYEEMKNSEYYLMDFDNNDYTNFNLLINRENWHFFRKCLDPLRENTNENLRLNLLYKATWHGFGHNSFKERAR